MANNLSLELKLLANVDQFSPNIKKASGDFSAAFDAIRNAAGKASADIQGALSKLSGIEGFRALQGGAAAAAKSLEELKRKYEFLVDSAKKAESGISVMRDAAAGAAEAVASISAAATKLSAFKALQDEAAAASRALDEVKRRRDFLLESSAKGGDAGIKLFSSDIEKARVEILRAAQALESKNAALRSLEPSLRAAGVDTSKLATEEGRLSAALATAKTDLAAANANLATMGVSGKGAGSVMSSLSRDVERAKSELLNAASAVATKNAALARMSASLAAAGVDTNRLAESEARLKNEAERSRESLAGVGQELTRQRTLAEAFGTLNIRPFKSIKDDIATAEAAFLTLKNSGELSMQALAQAKMRLSERIAELKSQTNGWSQSLANAKGGLIAAAAGFAALASTVKTSMDLESLSARMKYATGSAEGAASAMKFAADMANRIGIDSLSAQRGFSGIAAAAKGSSLEGEKTRRIFESIATASRVVGLSSEEMGGALLAVQQMISKGSVQSEELRGQLGERLPGAFGIAARAMGVTEAQLAKLLGTGQITANDFLPKFADELMKSMGPDIQDAAGSTAAQFAILGNHLRDIAVAVGSTLLPAVNKIVGALSAAAQAVAEFARAHPVFSSMVAIGGALMSSWAALATAGGALKVAAAGVLSHMTGLPAAFRTATTGVQAFRAALGPLLLAFSVGFEVGTWLRQFAAFRIAGVAMVHVMVLAIEQLRWYWESFVALFTSDTVAQANARHLARLREIGAITRDMYADAANEAKASGQERVNAEAKTAAAVRQFTQAQEDAYKGLQTLVDSEYAHRVQTITSYYATEQGLLDTTHLSEGAKLAAQTALMQEEYEKRKKTLADYVAQSIQLIDDENAARLAGMQKGTQLYAQMEKDALEAKRKIYEQGIKEAQAHIDALNREYLRHLEVVKSIEDQKLQFQASVDKTLQDIRNQDLTGFSAYQQKMTEIGRLEAKARDAIKAGEFTKAKEYGEQAIALAKGTSKEVKDGDTVIISSTEAKWKSMDKIRTISKLVAEAMDANSAAEKEKAEKAKQQWEESRNQLDQFKTSLTEVETKLSKQYTLTVTSNVGTVSKEIDALNGKNTSSTHTVHVVYDKPLPSGGGESSAPADSGTPSASGGGGAGGFSLGGLVRRFATGGPVFKSPSWAKVPGVGSEDTEPALLESGSFVVRKSASAYYGDGIMGRIAQGVSAVRKFASGGYLGDYGLKQFGAFGAAGGDASGAGESNVSKLMRRLQILLDYVSAQNRKLTLAGSDNIMNNGERADSMTLEGQINGARIRNPDGSIDESKLQSLVEVFAKVAQNARAGAIATSASSRLYDRSKRATDPLYDRLHQNDYGYYPWEAVSGKGFAAGGHAQGTDTVPAMLTPGEWVVKRSAVARYGLGLLDAINNMRIPREAFAGIGAAPVPRFAAGGLVGSAPVISSSSGPSTPGASTTVTNHFHLHGFEGTEDDVRRKIVPILNKIMNGSR